MSIINEEAGVTVFNGTGQKIEVLFQEEVQLDIDVPLFYIKSGEEEIQAYVNNHAKPELNEYTGQKKQDISEQTAESLAQISEKTAEDIEMVKEKINTYVENTAEPALQHYADETVKPQLEAVVSEAENAAGNAAASAEEAQNLSASALSSATQAESSASDASASAETAAGFVETARKWAIGTIEEQPEGSSEYWAGEAKLSAENANVGYELFQPAWFDHKPESASWLRADTFSWQDGGVYFAAYNELAAQYADTSSAETADTVGDITITYKRTPKGYKICTPEQAENVEALYESTGVAWYYILDTETERFKLPRTKWGFVGCRSNVGTYIPETLPNITGSTVGDISEATMTGALKVDAAYNAGMWQGAVSMTRMRSWSFNASLSSSAYQDEAPVQQRAVEMYLYFFVGNMIKDDTLIDAGQITEALSEKLDIDLNNLPVSGKSTICGLGKPSGRYINLTLGATGSTYTAPANGWAAWGGQFSTAAGNLSIGNDSFYSQGTATSGAQYIGVYIPVKKGENFYVDYAQVSATVLFRFIYDEGEN